MTPEDSTTDLSSPQHSYNSKCNLPSNQFVCTSASNENINNEFKQPSIRAPDMQMGRCRYVRLLDNITYIAGAVILRENEEKNLEILLIQETKKSCYGKWYLPAGRVEPGESIESAAIREAKEETGFDVEIKEIIKLDVQGSGWYRFIFFCEIVGGEIKTVPDRESLAAAWYSIEDVRQKNLLLRNKDIQEIVDDGEKYYRMYSGKKIINPCRIIPESQRGLFIEFVIVKKNMDKTKTEILVHKSCKNQEEIITRKDIFPTVEFGFEYIFPMVVSKCYRHILENGASQIEMPTKVINISVQASLENICHGIRLRILSPHKPSISKSPILDQARYTWIELTDEKVLQSLRLLEGQFITKLTML
uniref:Putative nudix hydrolase 1 (inferred by orthology to a C. elegans protein) n=1 Tax=Strongyloides venezuelensis TaxID=75913 RepID=A0A0K0F7I9_STRVS